jgi:hypothetical protein
MNWPFHTKLVLLTLRFRICLILHQRDSHKTNSRLTFPYPTGFQRSPLSVLLSCRSVRKCGLLLSQICQPLAHTATTMNETYQDMWLWWRARRNRTESRTQRSCYDGLNSYPVISMSIAWKSIYYLKFHISGPPI